MCVGGHHNHISTSSSNSDEPRQTKYTSSRIEIREAGTARLILSLEQSFFHCVSVKRVFQEIITENIIYIYIMFVYVYICI